MFIRFLKLIRFSHTLFALPFAVLSAAMAWRLNVEENGSYIPRIVDIAGILLCMVFARSAAMGFNRWADQKIDAANPRTANRHIPAGMLTSKSVLVFTAACSLGFIASTLLFLPNLIPVCFSLPVLLFLFGYSFTKRWTVSAHFWLGTALMLAPLAAWVVIRPVLFPIPLPPVLLGLAVLFWTAGFDLIYACQDAETDAKQKLFSIPGKFGIPAAFRISALCHCFSTLFFAAVFWIYPPFSWIFGSAVLLVALILFAEHWFSAPRKGEQPDVDRINIAFFQMNVAVSVGLLLAGVIDVVI